MDDAAFLRNNCVELLANQFEQIEVAQWVRLLEHYSPEIFNATFQKAGHKGEVGIIKHLLEILEKLVTTSDANLTKFVLSQLQLLPTYLTKTPLHKIREEYSYDDSLKDNITTIVEKIIDLSVHNEIDNKWVNKVAQSMTENLKRDYANEVLTAILLKNKYGGNVLAKNLYEILGQDLTKRTNKKPSPPKNWTRKVPKSKYYQNQLEILRTFLESPSQQVFNYTENQRYRDSMSSALRDVTIDLRMETITKGRPYTLRLTKTQSAYELKLKHWTEDSDLLTKLIKLDEN